MAMTIDERIDALARRVQTMGADRAVARLIWNMIATWDRYLGFLRIVLTRYEAANDLYIRLVRT